MDAHPAFSDIAHLGHVELLTPDLPASLEFFRMLIGLHVSGREGSSVYLRAWGDHERFTLKLMQSEISGLGHVAFRARSAAVLSRLVEFLQANDVKGRSLEPSLGQGPVFRFESPDTHTVELYYEVERFQPAGDQVPSFKNLPQRPDHVNLLAQDIRACRLVLSRPAGHAGYRADRLRRRPDRRVACSHQQILRPGPYPRPELHPRALSLRDLHDGQSRRHTARRRHPGRSRRGDRDRTPQTFYRANLFLSFYEPGGNRIEIGAGSYLIFDSDLQTVVWNRQERSCGQA